MDTLAETADLTRHADRRAGSDAERRCANDARAALVAAGREAVVEPILVRPRYALGLAIATVTAIAGSVLAVDSPEVGGALVLAAVLSLALEGAGLLHLARRLTGRRASQNVVSRDDRGRPGTLVLVAHLDAGRDSTRWERLAHRLGDPYAILLALLTLLLACCIARVAGVDAQALTAVQFVPTVVLILATPLLVDVELSPASTGAGDAAAASAAIRLGAELPDRLDHFDVWVLLTGASKPFALGMRAWLRRHRKSLHPTRTVFLELRAAGPGGVRYARREGQMIARRTRRQLTSLCAEIAEDDGADGDLAARPARVGRATDAAAATSRGFPAISVATEGPGTTPEGGDRLRAFCSELALRLDAEVGPGLRRE